MTRSSRVLIAVIATSAVYVGSFYLLMVPNCQAYDWNDKPAFNNCPRFSENYRVPGPLTIDTGRASFLNYMYYPFEFIHRGPKLKAVPNQGAGANVGERRAAACFNRALSAALPDMAQLSRSM
jgi:hypothetical protein